MDLGLKDKVALITGSARGLGRAIAEKLAGEKVKLASLLILNITSLISKYHWFNFEVSLV